MCERTKVAAIKMSVEKDSSSNAEEVNQEFQQAEDYKNQANEYFKSACLCVII